MGYRACSSVEVLTEILGDSTDINEHAVAYILAMMARTISGDQLVFVTRLFRGPWNW